MVVLCNYKKASRKTKLAPGEELNNRVQMFECLKKKILNLYVNVVSISHESNDRVYEFLHSSVVCVYCITTVCEDIHT